MHTSRTYVHSKPQMILSESETNLNANTKYATNPTY